MKKIFYTIFLLAFFLRFLGINYGMPAKEYPNRVSLYPDESVYIGIAMTAMKGIITDVEFFGEGPGYNNFIILYTKMLKLLKIIPRSVSYGTEEYAKGMKKILWTGRFFSVLSSFFSLIFIYLFTKNLFGENTAFVAIAIFAFMPGEIIMAHILKGDALSRFFAFSALYILSMQREKLNTVAFFLLGFAAGIKYVSALYFIAAFLIFPMKKKFTYSTLAAAGFLVSTPQIFTHFPLFVQSLKFHFLLQANQQPLYTLIDTFKWPEYFIAFYYSMGPLFFLLSLSSLILLLFKYREIPRTLRGIILSTILYCFILSFTYGPLMRYSVYLLPFLSIISSFCFLKYYPGRNIKYTLLGIFISYTFAAAFAYDINFLKQDPRITSSYWMFINVPKDKKIGYFVSSFWLPTITDTYYDKMFFLGNDLRKIDNSLDYLILNDLVLSKTFLKHHGFKNRTIYENYLNDIGFKRTIVFGEGFSFPLIPYCPGPVVNDWYFPFLKITIFINSKVNISSGSKEQIL